LYSTPPDLHRAKKRDAGTPVQTFLFVDGQEEEWQGCEDS
jgi:hypothetical protein